MRRERLDGVCVHRVRLHRKQGTAIAHTERLQQRKLVRDAGMVLALARNVQLGDEVLARIAAADIRVERFFKRFELVGADVDARRLRMSAELLNVIGARLERLKDIDAVDAPCTAAQHVAALDEEQRGTGEFLGNARRDDADKTRVPVLGGEHDDVAVRPLLPDLGDRLRVQFIARALALRIVDVEFFRECGNGVLVVRREQLKRGVRVPHPAGSVDAGRDREGERLCAHFRRLAHERRKGGARGARNAL